MDFASTSPGKISLWDQLSTAGREMLRQGIATKQCAADTILLRQGHPVSGAYMVMRGRLRVFSVSPDGREATLYFIEPGETCVLALNCLFNDLRYPAWVQADQACEIALIPGALYRKLFEREAAVQNLTVNSLSTLVFRLMGELEQVHSLRHRERLANWLLSRASTQGEVRITQQHLARHLGTSREVVARLLRDFADQGFVRTGRGQITLLDADGLRDSMGRGD